MTNTITPRYWVLPAYGYPDTQADYIPATSQEHARDITRRIGDGYMASGGSSVYVGSREPWDEHDPYPDYTCQDGPRGGMSLERA